MNASDRSAHSIEPRPDTNQWRTVCGGSSFGLVRSGCTKRIMSHGSGDSPRYLTTIDPNTKCGIRPQSKYDPSLLFYPPQSNVKISWFDNDFSRVRVHHGDVARTGPCSLIIDRILGRYCLGFQRLKPSPLRLTVQRIGLRPLVITADINVYFSY